MFLAPSPSLIAAADVDAVMVTYNSAGDLPSTLDGALFDAFRNVVVVDNGSTDATLELIGQTSAQLVEPGRNTGFAGAVNIGGALMGTEVFAVMNPDVDIRSCDHLERLLAHFDDPAVAVVAPALRLPSGDLQDSARSVPVPVDLVRRRMATRDRGRVSSSEPVDVPWTVGAFMLIRRSAFNLVGGFDHGYPLYFEDVDFCVRLRAAGWKVRFDPQVEIEHRHRAASRRHVMSRATRLHVFSAARFYLKHPHHILRDEGLRRHHATRGAGQAPELPRVHLAASPGGHMQLLKNVRGVFEDHERTWITAAGSHADELVAEGERVVALPRVRGVARREIARNLWRSVVTAWRERPSLVVTTGADMVVPFALVCRLLGARLVYVEAVTRVSSRSMTARILSPFCDLSFVQWPEQSGGARSTYVWPAPLEDLPPSIEVRSGSGTFVAFGTHTQAFPRLLDAVLRATEAGVLPAPVTIQSGYTPTPHRLPPGTLVHQWLRPDEMEGARRVADVVITHAGDASIFAALQAGRRPIVVARRERLAEHVDDHQLELVTKLAELGLVVAVEDAITVRDVEDAKTPIAVPARPDSVASLREALRSAVGALWTPPSG